MKPAEWIRRMPWSIPLLAAALMAMGLLALARCEDFGDEARHYLRQQVVWAGAGLGVMLAATLVSYRRLAAWSYFVFGVSVALLVLVYFFPVVNGAHRWLRIGRIGVQPSEFAKVAFVCVLGRYLMYRENYRRFRGLLPPLALATVPVLLILKEPDLGTAAVFLPVLLAMLLVAGARRADLLRLVAAGIVLLPLFWTQMSPYQKSRVSVLLHPPVAGERPSADAYQSYQARTMMALGGPWGSYLSGQPTADMAVYHLPEDNSDFILCVLIERFGLPGLAVVLVLSGLLVWRVTTVAAEAREPFGRLLAAGVAALIAVQVLMNTGVTVGLLPVTGLPLPLVSHGGSGLVAHCLALGLVINVALRPGYEMTNEPFRWRE
jgi:cell division protein FtsW (lipid II flippase)